jgi:hypothetical protein
VAELEIHADPDCENEDDGKLVGPEGQAKCRSNDAMASLRKSVVHWNCDVPQEGQQTEKLAEVYDMSSYNLGRDERI